MMILPFSHEFDNIDLIVDNARSHTTTTDSRTTTDNNYCGFDLPPPLCRYKRTCYLKASKSKRKQQRASSSSSSSNKITTTPRTASFPPKTYSLSSPRKNRYAMKMFPSTATTIANDYQQHPDKPRRKSCDDIFDMLKDHQDFSTTLDIDIDDDNNNEGHVVVSDCAPRRPQRRSSIRELCGSEMNATKNATTTPAAVLKKPQRQASLTAILDEALEVISAMPLPPVVVTKSTNAAA